MSLEFDYFYGNEAEQYAFYRIPKLLILICFYTGIRIGELCALTWENIDLKRSVQLEPQKYIGLAPELVKQLKGRTNIGENE